MKKIKNFKCPSFTTAINETVLSYPLCPDSGETTGSSSHASGINQTQSEKCLLRRVFSDSRTLLQRPCKRNSARLSKIAFSDTALPVSMETEATMSVTGSSEKCHSMQELRESLCVREENTLVENTVDQGVILNRSVDSIKIKLNLDELGKNNNELLAENKIGNITITLDGCTIYESSGNIDNPVNSEATKICSSNYNNSLAESKRLNYQLKGSKEAKSDSNLAVISRLRIHSVSCENVQTLDRSIESTYQNPPTKIVSQQKTNEVSHRKSNKKRSHSILTRFLDVKQTENGDFERMGTIRKKLSFLRKMWKREEKKPEEDALSNEYESIPIVTALSSPEGEKV